MVDVPITFQERVAGESKLSGKQQLLYLRQLSSLYWFKFGVLQVLAAVLVVGALLGFAMQIAPLRLR